MFPEMKYIVIRVKYSANQEIAGRAFMPADAGLEQEHPIIFPKALTHAEMARIPDFSEDFIGFTYDNTNVVSAGFLRYDDMRGWQCYGESESLKSSGIAGYKSRGEVDNDLLTCLHVNHGIVPDSEE